MFENNRISSVQVHRIFVLSTLGISLLTTTEISLYFGKRDGLFCILLGYIFTLLYTALIISFLKKKQHKTEEERKHHSWFSKVCAALLIVKYCFLLIPVLCLFTQLVRTALVPQRSIWLVLATGLLICLYLALQGIEAIGRLAQCLYVLVLLVCTLPVLWLLKDIDPYYTAPLYNTGIRTVLSGGLWIVTLLFPVELLYLGNGNFNSSESLPAYSQKCYRAISLVYLLNGIYYVANVGCLSVNGIEVRHRIPATLQLLNRLRISNFLLLFFLISLCFTVCILLYAAFGLFRYLLPDTLYKAPKTARRILAGIVTAAVFLVSLTTFYLAPEYEAARFASQNRANIEHRIYTNAVILSYDAANKCFSMSLLFPKNNNSTTKAKTVTSDSLSELTAEYARNGNKELDFSHTEVLLLADSIYTNPDCFQNTVAYLNSLDKFNHQTLICGIRQTPEEYVALNESLDIPLGEYLSRLTKTNLPFARTTLEALKKVNISTEPACVIAEFSIQDDLPYYSGSMILNQKGLVAQYNASQSAILNFIYGKQDFILPLGQKHQYKVTRNEYLIRISVSQKGTPLVKIIYSGSVESMKDKDLSQDALNQLLSIVIEEQLHSLIQEQQCDLLNIYKHLAIDAPKLYVKYQKHPMELLRQCQLQAECRYQISEGAYNH